MPVHRNLLKCALIYKVGQFPAINKPSLDLNMNYPQNNDIMEKTNHLYILVERFQLTPDAY